MESAMPGGSLDRTSKNHTALSPLPVECYMFEVCTEVLMTVNATVSVCAITTLLQSVTQRYTI